MEAYYEDLPEVPRDGFTPNLDFVDLAVVEQQEYGMRSKKSIETFLHAIVNGIDGIDEKYKTLRAVKYDET